MVRRAEARSSRAPRSPSGSAPRTLHVHRAVPAAILLFSSSWPAGHVAHLLRKRRPRPNFRLDRFQPAAGRRRAAAPWRPGSGLGPRPAPPRPSSSAAISLSVGRTSALRRHHGRRRGEAAPYASVFPSVRVSEARRGAVLEEKSVRGRGHGGPAGGTWTRPGFSLPSRPASDLFP